MVLASQRQRSGGSFNNQYSSRRRWGKWLAGGATVVAIAAIYGLSVLGERWGSHPGADSGTPAAQNTNEAGGLGAAAPVTLATPDNADSKSESVQADTPAAPVAMPAPTVLTPAAPVVPAAPAAVPAPVESPAPAVVATLALATPPAPPAVAALVPSAATTEPAPRAQIAALVPVTLAEPVTPTGSVAVTVTAATMPATTAPAANLSATDQARLGILLVEQGKMLDARNLLNDLLVNHPYQITAADAELVRTAMAKANEDLIFSTKVAPGDPLVERYTVQVGDVLSKVAPRYHIPYQIIEQINGIKAPTVRVDQKIKVIKGPFHVVVHKAAFRMDLFLNDPDGKPVYIRSFPIGLGEGNSTPEGNWVVALNGKVTKPSWTNPRTGQFFAADDPKNPLGGYWIRIEGADDKTRGLAGYGLHGTIEPESIGKQMSMGCVRLAPDDIALVFKLLVGQASTVRIEP